MGLEKIIQSLDSSVCRIRNVLHKNEETELHIMDHIYNMELQNFNPNPSAL